MMFGGTSMTGIMIFRLSSMYNYDRKIIYVLISAFVFETVFVSIFTIVGYYFRIGKLLITVVCIA